MNSTLSPHEDTSDGGHLEPLVAAAVPDSGDDAKALALASLQQWLVSYEAEYVAPVTKLHDTLAEVLDVDANPDRHPDEALAVLKGAMETFQEESANWLSTTQP